MKDNIETRIGTIVSVDQHRGFGFINPEDSDQNTFFHFSNIICSAHELEEGSKVTYTIKKGRKGIEGNHIKKI